MDCTAFATLAGQRGVLPRLALLSRQKWVGPVADCITQTLLNLLCAVIAAFDLSPFSLPAAQLHAVLEVMVNLYEGRFVCH